MIFIIILNQLLETVKNFFLIRKIILFCLFLLFILPSFGQDKQNHTQTQAPASQNIKNELSDTEYLEKINQYMSDESENSKADLNREANNRQRSGPQNSTLSDSQYDLGMLLRFILSLLLVVGAIYLIYFLLKKKYKLDTASSGFIRILLSQSLAPGKLIQVIEMAGKCFVLGITNDNINLITEIEDKETVDQLKINASENEGNKKSFMKNLFHFLNNPASGNQFLHNKKNMNNFNPFTILDTGKSRLKKINGEK